MKRYLASCVLEDLQQKMVFIGGPRQVGKTTLALQLIQAEDETSPGYLNYDLSHDREKMLNGDFPVDQKILILDEIHKYKPWRNLIKGFYDKLRSRHAFLVTGSAKLDHYHRGGDSLQGRYHYYRLHPLHLDEVDDLQRLLEFGGFPEPYLMADRRHWNRWQNERRRRVTFEDIASLESVRELNQLDLLATVLPEKVGGLLSIKNLAQDLSIAFATAERWIEILESLYYCFRIQPHHSKTLATTKKERKLFLWDWSLVQNQGARLENFVANYLLKYCHFRHDYHGEELSLRFLRDRDQREIDFVIVEKGQPVIGIECKSLSKTLSPHVKFFAKKIPFKQLIQLHLGEDDFVNAEHDIRCLPVTSLPKVLPIG